MFDGKAVLVTGAASGMGKATAARFAQEGGRVCVADLDIDGAERTAQAIQDAGGDAFACRVNIAEAADNDRMIADTASTFGRIDIIHFNAGFLGPSTNFFDSTLADFDRIIGVNLRGLYLGLKSAGAAMAKGGAIVVTSSTAGVRGWSDNAPYSTSKHGIIGLVRSSAKAFAERGIRINAICPGMVSTPMIMPDAAEDALMAPDDLTMPDFGGLATAQHIAELVLFLASNRAAFMTGGVHIIDGGLTSGF